MAKVLLTSIGTGRYDINSSVKTYSKAKYRDPDSGEFLETAYMYEALIKFRGIERIVFIGTAGSNWFLLYEHLFDEESIIRPQTAKDERVSEALLDLSLKPAPGAVDPSEVRRLLEPLKAAFGNVCLDIVVLKYGLTDEEIAYNIQNLAILSDQIKPGDCLSFDITHSFRSLAFYELLTVNYLQKVRGQGIGIDFVSYGIFEIRNENDGYTPITDQTVFLELLDWTNAAEEYRRFGTTYSLVELLGKSTLGDDLTPEELEILRALSDSVIINDLTHFRKLIDRCKALSKNTDDGRFLNPAVRYVFDDIYTRFGDAVSDRMILTVEFARWHMDKQRYINAAILICESMIQFCSNLTGKSNDDIRDRLRHGKPHDSLVGNLLHEYNSVREIRNKLCHGAPLEESAIQNLYEHIRSYASIYTRHFRQNESNQKLLIAMLIPDK